MTMLMVQSRRRLSFGVKKVDENQGNTCALCNSQSAKVSTSQTWKDKRAQLVARSLCLSSDQTVCQACRGDIRRFKIPTMYPGGQDKKQQQKCSRLQRNIIHPNSSSVRRTDMFSIGDFHYTTNSNPYPTLYHTVYNQHRVTVLPVDLP